MFKFFKKLFIKKKQEQNMVNSKKSSLIKALFVKYIYKHILYMIFARTCILMIKVVNKVPFALVTVSNLTHLYLLVSTKLIHCHMYKQYKQNT